jgi:hypothetical protein
VAHHPGTEWEVRWPDPHGVFWVTEQGYVGRPRKFFETEVVYRYQATSGLVQVAKVKGDFYGYGLDSTERWLIGERVYGFEMGAYDLVARNLKTSEERTICHGVEEFEALE